jgi:hypothetical protein
MFGYFCCLLLRIPFLSSLWTVHEGEEQHSQYEFAAFFLISRAKFFLSLLFAKLNYRVVRISLADFFGVSRDLPLERRKLKWSANDGLGILVSEHCLGPRTFTSSRDNCDVVCDLLSASAAATTFAAAATSASAMQCCGESVHVTGRSEHPNNANADAATTAQAGPVGMRQSVPERLPLANLHQPLVSKWNDWWEWVQSSLHIQCNLLLFLFFPQNHPNRSSAPTNSVKNLSVNITCNNKLSNKSNCSSSSSSSNNNSNSSSNNTNTWYTLKQCRPSLIFTKFTTRTRDERRWKAPDSMLV